jgi:transposase
MSTKICRVCKEEKTLEFFSRNLHKIDGLNAECKECQKRIFKEYYQKNKQAHINRVAKRTNRVNETIAQIKTNRGCTSCEENFSYCLEFHHLDPNQKDGLVGEAKIFEKTIEEISKCVLVCRNCHIKAHKGLISLDENDLIVLTPEEIEKIELAFVRKQYKYHEKKDVQRKPRPSTSPCPAKYILEKLIETKTTKEISDIYKVSQLTIVRWLRKLKIDKIHGRHWGEMPPKVDNIPPKQELEDLIWKIPSTQIAKKYNVSDSAIVKWCRKYGIKKPPRGYWRQQECLNK